MASLPTELAVMSPSLEDVERQRCRLGSRVMDKLVVGVGDCVQIDHDNHNYVCKAFPSVDGWNGAIRFDTSAKIVGSRHPKIDLISHRIPISCIRKIETVKLSDIHVSVVLTKLQKVLRIRKLDKSHSDYNTFKKNVIDILRKTYLMRDMRFNCSHTPLGKMYGISYILVHKINSSSEGDVCGMISSQSTLVVDSVISLERFDLSQEKTSLTIGGFHHEVQRLDELLDYCTQDDKFKSIGISRTKGVFIRGPAGCGKTTLVKKCSSDRDFSLKTVRCTEILGSRPGEGESKLRVIFKAAVTMSEEAPTVLLLEDIDSICSKKSAGGSGNALEKRMTSQLAALLDQLNTSSCILIVATSSKPQLVDNSLLTTGRLEKEIFMGIPSSVQRCDMLSCLLSNLKLDEDVDIKRIADASPGFVAADLKSLVDQAHFLAISENTLENIKEVHLMKALHSIVPSSQRGSDVFVDHQPVSWNDIGGLENVIMKIKQAVEWPLKHGSAFTRLGIPRPGGLLLYGPPGCAKTLLARAAASACGVTFMAISGAQMNSPFVGDAERKLSEVFRQARENAPSILFIDEVDAVVGKRREGKSQGGAHDRVLSTFLNEMDGIGLRLDEVVKVVPQRLLLEGDSTTTTDSQIDMSESEVDNSGVLVVAATNRPDMIDAALMRPGRFDKIIYVPPPDEPARMKILEVHTRNMPCEEVDLSQLSHMTEGFTGADLENLCREAALNALTQIGLNASKVRSKDFHDALSKMEPSLSNDVLQFYGNLLSNKSSCKQ